MSNSIETYRLPDGLITFDHATGIMSAQWDNGYKETWSKRGYDIQTKLKSFYLFTEQWVKYNDL